MASLGTHVGHPLLKDSPLYSLFLPLFFTLKADRLLQPPRSQLPGLRALGLSTSLPQYLSKQQHCQRVLPGHAAGGNLLPSPSSVKELIVPGRRNTVNTGLECALLETDKLTWRHTQTCKHTHCSVKIYTNRFLRIKRGSVSAVRRLPRSPVHNINSCSPQQVNQGDCGSLIFPWKKQFVSHNNEYVTSRNLVTWEHLEGKKWEEGEKRGRIKGNREGEKQRLRSW